MSQESKVPQFASIFDDMRASAYPFRYEGTLQIKTLMGGTPSDPRVIDGWMRTKIGLSKEEDLKAQIAAIVAERDIPARDAAAEIARTRCLNGFLRDRCRECLPVTGSEEIPPLCEGGKHQLKIAGRQLKAGLKEAANVSVAAGMLPSRGWGTTNKGLLSFFAEHFFLADDDLLLEDPSGHPIYEPTGIIQHFVHTPRFGSAIQYQEHVDNCQINFTVIGDYLITDEEWAQIWLRGQMQGLGASRSQGYGRYEVSRWDNETPHSVMAKGKAKALKATAATGDVESVAG